MTQQYLEWSDLTALDSSPDAVRSAFKSHFSNVDPDGIALNDSTYYDAVTPPITQQYSHYCYKIPGDVQYYESAPTSSTHAVVGSNIAYNKSDSEATIQLTVNGAWTDTRGWSSSITRGMTFTEEISLEGVFKLGMSFNVSATVGKSGSQSVSKSSSASVSVKVPPKSKIKVDMVATMKTEKMDFEVPIQVSGMFGANFPSRVDGHYIWFLSASSILPKTSGTIKGTIEGTAAFDVTTHIGQAEPIN